jgi:adenosylmethionine-8-amino-7-oxononanoate aminotransferase
MLMDTEALRRSSLEHNWLHSRDWIKMAEEGDPLIIVDGNGLEVTDSDGNKYLDVNGGYSCVNVGYGRTEIAEAVLEQMLQLTFTPRGTTTPAVVEFCERLAGLAPGDLERSWPVTGGSEANETAIKIAKAYHRRNGEAGRYKVISRRGSYHGATGMATWLGGRGSRADFEPAYPGMVYAPQPNSYRSEAGGDTPSEVAVRSAQAIEDLIRFHGPETVAAVIGEPICITLSEGVVVPGDEYWPMVREICDRYGVLLIADEVVTGFGRTGRWFGMEHSGVVPDIMSVAKGVVSSYVPMAATIATTRVADAFAGPTNLFPSTLTFGGHPVIAAAAIANIDIMEREDLVGRAADMGEYLLEQLRPLSEEHSIVGDVRGIGLLSCLELVENRDTKEPFPKELGLADRLTGKLRRHGLIMRTSDDIITVTPPLCVTRGEIDRIANAIDMVLGEIEAELGIDG